MIRAENAKLGIGEVVLGLDLSQDVPHLQEPPHVGIRLTV